jgi:hypothetical protein
MAVMCEWKNVFFYSAFSHLDVKSIKEIHHTGTDLVMPSIFVIASFSKLDMSSQGVAESCQFNPFWDVGIAMLDVVSI